MKNEIVVSIKVDKGQLCAFLHDPVRLDYRLPIDPAHQGHGFDQFASALLDTLRRRAKR